MQSIKQLISIAAFLLGTYQAVCIVDGSALLTSSERNLLKLELRFAPRSLPTKDVSGLTFEKQGAPPVHRASVTPISQAQLPNTK